MKDKEILSSDLDKMYNQTLRLLRQYRHDGALADADEMFNAHLSGILNTLLEEWSTHNDTVALWRPALFRQSGEAFLLEAYDKPSNVRVEVGIHRERVFLEMSISHPENLLHMSDDFWEEWQELHHYGHFEIVENTVFSQEQVRRFPELFAEVYRVLRKDSHFYLFCDPETMFVAKPLAEEAGFKFWKPVIWDKVSIGMGYHYRARYECVLFFEKGKRKLNDLGIADIIAHKRINGGYPAEKPPEVSEVLVRQSSEPGELVVDPFAGSGSVGVAAARNGRDFRGNDLCLEAVEIAKSRLVAEGAREGGRALREETVPQLGLTL